MSADRVIQTWKQVRDGLIDEVNQIPPEQFSFRATPDTRSVAELIQHVIQAQKTLAGETCRPDTNFRRQPFPDHLKEYAPETAGVEDKNGLIELLRNSMETTEATIRAAADRMDDTMLGLDRKETTKVDFLRFAISHEMYHRGQLTVYQRLMSVEPVLTQRLKKLFAPRETGQAAQNAN